MWHSRLLPVRREILARAAWPPLWAMVLVLIGDRSVAIPTPSAGQMAAEPPPVQLEPPTNRTVSVSTQAAYTMIGLIGEARMQRPTSVLDTLAAASHWRKTPPEFNAMINAKVAYATSFSGHRVFLGGDGTNDIFAIMLADVFEPHDVVDALKQVYSLKKQDTEDSSGARIDRYILQDHGEDLGVLVLTYGLAEPIRGKGTIAFTGMNRFGKELAQYHSGPAAQQ
jgi:hypothetical protein